MGAGMAGGQLLQGLARKFRVSWCRDDQPFRTELHLGFSFRSGGRSLVIDRAYRVIAIYAIIETVETTDPTRTSRRAKLSRGGGTLRGLRTHSYGRTRGGGGLRIGLIEYGWCNSS